MYGGNIQSEFIGNARVIIKQQGKRVADAEKLIGRATGHLSKCVSEANRVKLSLNEAAIIADFVGLTIDELLDPRIRTKAERERLMSQIEELNAKLKELENADM